MRIFLLLLDTPDEHHRLILHPLRISITSWCVPCPPHPHQHTLSTECRCVGILRSLCGQCGGAAAGQCRCPSKMRQRRWKARPIRAKAGANAANQGRLWSALEIGTPQVGLSCPELAVTTPSSQVSHTPLTFIEASGTGRASEGWYPKPVCWLKSKELCYTKTPY